MKQAHEILGVSSNAEWLVIEAAWRALMKRYHPDVDSSPEAAARACEVNAAFDQLKAARALQEELRGDGPEAGSPLPQDRGTARGATGFGAPHLRIAHAARPLPWLAIAVGVLALAVLALSLRPTAQTIEPKSGSASGSPTNASFWIEEAGRKGIADAADVAEARRAGYSDDEILAHLDAEFAGWRNRGWVRPTVQDAASARRSRDVVAGPIDLAAATLSSSGLGPIRIGMRREEVEALAGPLAKRHGDDGCSVFDAARIEGLEFLFEDAQLSRVSAYRLPSIRTPRGISAGATVDEVRQAYGPTLVETPHVYQPEGSLYLIYRVSPAPTTGQRGVKFETDQNGTVTALHGGGSSIGYVEGCL